MENLFQSEFRLETKRFHLKGVTSTMIHQMYLHSEKHAIIGFSALENPDMKDIKVFTKTG